MELEEFEKSYELEDSHWWFVGRRSLTASLVQHLAPETSGPVLDVGCGTGGNLLFLARYGPGTGIDLSFQAFDYCHRRGLCNLAQASVLQLPFADNVFGLVTAFDVLYHEAVGDDLAALRECYRICRPGGKFLMTDSAFPFLRSHHDVVYHGARRYTVRTLRGRVEAAGFRVLKLSYCNSFLFPFVVGVRLFGRMTGWRPLANGSDLRREPLLLNELLTWLYKVEAALQPWIPFPFGSSVVCLAGKGE
jgi:ubiquinone/menaquinone biosynthesis C-methylase UbiE